jgi:hypothetical protein
VDEAPSANNPSTGLEFTYRKDGFEIITSIYWQRFGANGPFRASGDPEVDTEIIDSSLSAVMASATFLWSTAFTDWFSLQYGLGVGLGALLGDVNRTEAYPQGNGYGACNSAGDPDGTFCGGVNTAEPYFAPSCPAGDPNCTARPGKPASNRDGADGEHYDVNARKWTDGGSVPNLWFRFTLPHLALRFKPIRQMVIRIDGGWDIFSGFFLGGALAFGI